MLNFSRSRRKKRWTNRTASLSHHHKVFHVMYFAQDDDDDDDDDADGSSATHSFTHSLTCFLSCTWARILIVDETHAHLSFLYTFLCLDLSHIEDSSSFLDFSLCRGYLSLSSSLFSVISSHSATHSFSRSASHFLSLFLCWTITNSQLLQHDAKPKEQPKQFPWIK